MHYDNDVFIHLNFPAEQQIESGLSVYNDALRPTEFYLSIWIRFVS
ncbi:hypothetical protein FHR87_002454 [Azomonas macrocytogenes]|uniref:Uncharacterized protein n=1 Tax=Azomonas macrocytogenes TaxID=69962 RepID=A0A839T3R1_AZOMA|nr:hypothetical protein [Azomonas macrocytogenes]